MLWLNLVKVYCWEVVKVHVVRAYMAQSDKKRLHRSRPNLPHHIPPTRSIAQNFLNIVAVHV